MNSPPTNSSNHKRPISGSLVRTARGAPSATAATITTIQNPAFLFLHHDGSQPHHHRSPAPDHTYTSTTGAWQTRHQQQQPNQQELLVPRLRLRCVRTLRAALELELSLRERVCGFEPPQAGTVLHVHEWVL